MNRIYHSEYEKGRDGKPSDLAMPIVAAKQGDAIPRAVNLRAAFRLNATKARNLVTIVEAELLWDHSSPE